LIEVRYDEKIVAATKRRFCNQTCRELYNRNGVMSRGPKNTKSVREKNPSTKRINTTVRNSHGECTRCKAQVVYRPHTTKAGYYNSRSYCDDCLNVVRKEVAKRSHGKNALSKLITEFTKGELLNLKGYTNYRNLLIKHANKVFDESGKSRKCHVCNYPLVDICHIKDVSDFSEDTLIAEINNIDNLVALCPTHHREFDKKLFSL
jgi:hypothetical protein